MSERGSFVTQYIYCDRCFEAACQVLLHRSKYLCSTAIPSWRDDLEQPEPLPIIAGKLGGLYDGEEIHAMNELLRILKPRLCDEHSIRVVVMPANDTPTLINTDLLPTRPTRIAYDGTGYPPPWHRRPNALDGVPDEEWKAEIE